MIAITVQHFTKSSLRQRLSARTGEKEHDENRVLFPAIAAAHPELGETLALSADPHEVLGPL